MSDEKRATLDYLVDTLNVMVPFRMAEIHEAARRRSRGDEAEYARLVRMIGQRVDDRHWMRDKTRGLVNRLTGLPIGDSNASIVASGGDSIFGRSRAGSGETIMVAFASLVAAGALVSPVGVSFHGGHWCRGACKATVHS